MQSGQGKDVQVNHLLEDNETSLAIEQYITHAEKQDNSEGLANAATNYWHSLKDEFGEKDEAESQSQLEFKGDEFDACTAQKLFW